MVSIPKTTEGIDSIDLSHGFPFQLLDCLFLNSCQYTQLCLTKEVPKESDADCYQNGTPPPNNQHGSLRILGKHDQSSGSTSGGFLFVSLLPLDPVPFCGFLA